MNESSEDENSRLSDETERPINEILHDLFPQLSEADVHAIEADLGAILSDVYEQYVIFKTKVEDRLKE